MRKKKGEQDDPFVSVIIPTYRDWNALTVCLEALENQSYPRGKFEIIVVNNDPSGCEELAVKPSNMRILNESTPGSYAARNMGVINAKGQIVAFTDADCVPHSDWLKNAVEVFLRRPDLCRIAGHIELQCGDGDPSLSMLYEKVFAFPQRRSAESGTSVTANMLCRKHVFKKIGLFNDRMGSREDKEWGLRAYDAGCKIEYIQDVIVNHPARGSLKELLAKARRTYGGWYLLWGWNNKPFIVQMVYSLYALRPPLNPVRIILRNTQISFREKALVCFVLLLVRTSRFIEHLRLAAGAKVKRK